MRIRMGLVAGAGLMVLVVAGGGKAAPAAPLGLANEALCAAEAGHQERNWGIPARLLESISIVESGRWDSARKASVAWPWTVTAEGKGNYFPTKDEAVAEVKRLKAKGVRNIDVGCMQVNLHYHPQAFESLDEAFDPGANVAYAARFLKGLHGATNHWITAASYYHSQTPHLAAAYRERLLKVWNGSGADGRAFASVKPLVGQNKPKPTTPAVQEMRDSWKTQAASSRDEARRIADAYRQARLSEYQLRRDRMKESRRASGLSPDGY